MSFTELIFVVNRELYFTGHFSGLLRGLTGNYWGTKVASHMHAGTGKSRNQQPPPDHYLPKTLFVLSGHT